MVERGYLVLTRDWQKGDMVELNLPMPVQRVAAHPNVKANHGLLALQRGPLVYCLEACDQAEPLASLYLPADTELKAEKSEDLLGGVVVIKGEARAGCGAGLESPALPSQPRPPRRVPFTAIPYYAWDNRAARRNEGLAAHGRAASPDRRRAGGAGRRSPCPSPTTTPSRSGINDGIEPKSSGEQPAGALPLVAAQGQRGVGPIHLEAPGHRRRREGLLVRRHRPRRMPPAGFLADPVPRRRPIGSP